jgi:nucleoside 2-deoxyribosyltransferase
MARNKIRLDGWYSAETLGGVFKVFRGYANLKTLNQISVPFNYSPSDNTGYQREIIDLHAKEIKDYFESKREGYKFIPEIILGARLDPDQNIIALRSGFTSEETISLFHPEQSVPSATAISDASKPTASYGKKASIIIDLNQLKRKEGTIRRIDGNHRLCYALELVDDPNNLNKYVVPFCFVLLGPVENNKNDDFAEAMIFYNINQKSKPIESEHGFNVLLTAGKDDAQLFEQDPILYCAKYLKEELQHRPSKLIEVFSKTPLTNMYELVLILKEQNAIDLADRDKTKQRLKELLDGIDQYFNWAFTEGLKIATDFKIIPAILLMLLDNKKIADIKYWLTNYDKWIVKTHLLDEFISMRPAEIWTIFRKWKDSQPKTIFIACSFFDTPELNAMRIMIKEAIDKIKEKQPDINIIPVRVDEIKGESFDLSKEIFDQIDNSDLMIADLTGDRPNVYCEVGYAKARGIPFILSFKNLPNPTEGEQKKKIHTDLVPYTYIQYSEATHLRNELIKHLAAIYELS